MAPSRERGDDRAIRRKSIAGATDGKAQLENLQKRIAHFKSKRDARRPTISGPMKEAGSAFNVVVRLLSELAAGIGFGLFIGYWLDRWAGTRPLFIILFLFLGLAAAVRNIVHIQEGALKKASSFPSPDRAQEEQIDPGRENCGNPPNDV